jgi:Ca2+-dependent lipid-binding protein
LLFSAKKKDPYMVFYKLEDDDSKTKIHQTEYVKQNLDPVWQPFSLPVKYLTRNGNPRDEETILIETYDWDSDTKSDLIGITKVTFKNLFEAKPLP